jgi:aminoglycoside 3-N-acetyltransferase
MPVTESDIRQATVELGLSGTALCVHSSLRSFGWVEGGADAVIDALLAEGCTVLVPTMTWAYAVRPPPHLRPARNGTDYEALDRMYDANRPAGASMVYSPESNDLERGSMGAIPAALLQRWGRQRGRDPMGSFAALGPMAEQLVRDQTPDNPFAPFQELVRLGGSVVMMGVDLDRLTLLHQAEAVAGRNLFMRWANGPHGTPVPVFGGGCSDGFPRLEPFLAHLIRETRVGDSLWRVLPARETLAVAAEVIRAQPEITRCDDKDCDRCEDAIAGGPLLSAALLQLPWTRARSGI